MKQQLLAVILASGVLVTPVQARDRAFYVGIEGGVASPRDQDVDARVDYTWNEHSFGIRLPPGPADTSYPGAFSTEWKAGADIAGVVGYDFGLFRMELELGHKGARHRALEASEEFVANFNRDLIEAPTGGSFDPPLIAGDLTQAGGKIRVKSAMVNALAEFDAGERFVFYGGGGLGKVRAEALSDKEHAWAWQLIGGVRYSMSPNFEVGVKYRYFRTGRLGLIGETMRYTSHRRFAAICVIRPCTLVQTITADLSPEMRESFTTQSLLATLTFNFGVRNRS
ncbi:MAG TPA: outer membrane beta-barrel protein [Sphingomicrobium sp.]|nr:outer membrane beta-barrel protein [Sphingomicrobium sp.]